VNEYFGAVVKRDMLLGGGVLPKGRSDAGRSQDKKAIRQDAGAARSMRSLARTGASGHACG
jgi:hypothetical protein